MPMTCNTKPLSGDDICIWPDDVYCEASELDQYQHKSDDYIRIPVDCWLHDRVSEGEMTYDQVVAGIKSDLEAIDRV